MIHYCPNCKQNTHQRIDLLNPDKPSEGEIYVCNNCGESTGFRDKESADEQLYMDIERINTIVYGNDPHAAAERTAHSDYDEEPTQPDPPHDLQRDELYLPGDLGSVQDFNGFERPIKQIFHGNDGQHSITIGPAQEAPGCKNCGRVSGIENGQWIGISEDGYCTKCVAWLEDNGRTYNDFTDYLPYE